MLSGSAVFSYRAEEWLARITGGQSVSYTITRKAGRAGRYLTAAWACPPTTSDGHLPRRARAATFGRTARSWRWTSTTDTSRCGASTRTATRSADPHRIESTYRVLSRAGMPRSGMPSPG